MPLVQVSLAAGRSPEQLRRLIHELHGAVVRSVDADPERVRVILNEVPPTHWATGDRTLAERAAARRAAAGGEERRD
jgi:4-oxalocrotonate tautomerase